MIEQLDPSTLHVIHPVCGCVLLITDLRCDAATIQLEGICYRCDRYVKAEIKVSLLPSTEIGDISNVRFAAKNLKERLVSDAFHRFSGNVSKVATATGLQRSQVYNILKAIGLR